MTISTTYTELSGNGILNRLDPAEYQRLFRFFRVVDLEPQQTLYSPGDETTYVFFPVGAVATSVAVMNDSSTVETAMTGREGVVGVGAVMGGSRAHYWTRVLLPGEALRVEAGTLRSLFEESEHWQKMLLRYYGTLIQQVSRRAICNSRHRLNERLCTWVLMLRDRYPSDDLPITQEVVARQLGVRRAGVNECVGWLERLRAVEHKRGHIRVVSREALEDAACVCYHGFKAEVGWFDNAPAKRGGGALTVVTDVWEREMNRADFDLHLGFA